MQEIKKAKKSVNVKKNILLTLGFIIPYIPIISVFVIIVWLLDTTYNLLVTDILACIGLLFIFIIFWKLTKWLSLRIDKWLTDKYGSKDDDFIDEED